VARLASGVEIKEIVAHIASYCEHILRGIFSTASTLQLRGAHKTLASDNVNRTPTTLPRVPSNRSLGGTLLPSQDCH
jgi:hypothetical protein